MGVILSGSGIQYRFVDKNVVTLENLKTGDLTTESLLSAAGPFVLAAAEPEEMPDTGPVEQEDLMVRGAPFSGYNILNASTATKTDTPIFDTPVSIQVVPRAVMDDQQAIRPKDVLKNVSGVQPGFSFGTLRDRSIIRGFETDDFPQGGSYLDGVLQFEATYSLANIERVEMLKGASAMLYGRLQPGGVINYVSKRPKESAYYSPQQQFGSFDTYRTTLDATGPVSGDGSSLYGLNFENLDSDTFRDFATIERVFVAPSLTWKIGERTQLDLDFISQGEDAFDDYGLPAIGNGVANVPVERFTGEPDDGSNTEFLQGGITFNHEFNDHWQMNAKFSKYNMSGFFDETVSESLDESTGTGDRWLYDASTGIDSYFFTANTTRNFTTGPLDHTLLIGGDYYNRKYHEDGIFVDPFSTATGRFPSPINIFNPVYGYDKAAVLAGQTRFPFQTADEWWGIYDQDQPTLAEQWNLLAGALFDHAESEQSFNYDRNADVRAADDKFSPRVGLLYQPWNWFGIYRNYSQSFNRPIVCVSAADGSALDSETSEQFEGGIKTEWFDGQLTAYAVYFHLTKQNIAQPISPHPGSPSDLSGEARSQGLELDIGGQIREDWEVIATYTYTDSKFTEEKTDQGNRLPNVAEPMGSLWSNYRFDHFGLQGLSAGASVFLVGSRFGGKANTFKLPGYARVDTVLSYSKKIGEATLTAQFNIENLLDKRYFLTANSDSFVSRFAITPGATAHSRDHCSWTICRISAGRNPAGPGRHSIVFKASIFSSIHDTSAASVTGDYTE